jgi:uncharacterized protein
MTDTLQFLYYFTPGERPTLGQGPEDWTDEDNLISTAHYERLKKYTEEGVVLLAGRSTDWKGPAVVIFEATSQEEAEEFMQNDPFVKEKLFNASLHPFRAALVRKLIVIKEAL